MRMRRLQIGPGIALGLATAALLAGRPALAEQEEVMAQPVVNFSAAYTRLLGAAPIKPPVLFAADTDAVAAKMEADSWYKNGAAGSPYGNSGAYPFYRGFGGYYGPWAGYGGYGYFGAPFAGFWQGSYRPYGYLNFSPFASGFQPVGAAPYFANRPPFLGTTVYAYPPYGMGNFGSQFYW